jgi:hypothetical protein
MLKDDIATIPELKNIGLALIEFAESLFPDTQFEAEGKRWVARPNNFVTFEVHWQRVRNITMSLRGNPEEFIESDKLPLNAGMAGYSECKVTSPKQLDVASSYVARAGELYKRGRDRTRTTPAVIE